MNLACFSPALLASPDFLVLDGREVGAFFVLALAATAEGLPDDDLVLARVARVTARAWEKMAGRIRALFEAKGGRLWCRVAQIMDRAAPAKDPVKQAAARARWARDPRQMEVEMEPGVRSIRNAPAPDSASGSAYAPASCSPVDDVGIDSVLSSPPEAEFLPGDVAECEASRGAPPGATPHDFVRSWLEGTSERLGLCLAPPDDVIVRQVYAAKGAASMCNLEDLLGRVTRQPGLGAGSPSRIRSWGFFPGYVRRQIGGRAAA